MWIILEHCIHGGQPLSLLIRSILHRDTNALAGARTHGPEGPRLDALKSRNDSGGKSEPTWTQWISKEPIEDIELLYQKKLILFLVSSSTLTSYIDLTYARYLPEMATLMNRNSLSQGIVIYHQMQSRQEYNSQPWTAVLAPNCESQTSTVTMTLPMPTASVTLTLPLKSFQIY